MLSSGNNASRGSTTLSCSDVPPLPHCLPLEPIILGNQKYTRSGELRRVLGVPLGSTSGDHSFGVAHLKPTPPVATEELKNFKESVQDASRKARDRAKMLRESIFKLEKFREALSSKKRQRTDLLCTERSGGENILKTGSHVLRNPHDHPAQRLEVKNKNVGLGPKKRIRTSMVDAQADGRSAVVPRQQTIVEKDRTAAIQIEEKIRRLPAGGEVWDKKMKRKRSVGTVGTRVVSGDRDLKRAMQPKLSADTKSRPSEAHGFRSRSSPGMSGINKLDDPFEPANSSSGAVLRNELESIPPPRYRTAMLEERLVAKGNNKQNIHGENPAGSPSSMIKGKVSRTPRTGSVTMVDSSPDAHPSSGTLGVWEQPTNGSKTSALDMTNNHKRPMSTGSSSHHMARWVGQRPNKISRTRRANLIPPVSNSDEAQISSQGFTTSDLSSRSPHITSELLLANGVDNNNPKFKMKPENVPSPVGLSEGEESGGGENKLKEKDPDTGEFVVNADHKARAFILPSRKNKIPVKQEIGGDVRGQGRMERTLTSTRPAITPTREKVENLPTTKPLQSMRRGSDKNKSRSGRPPSKKLTHRKTSTHAGHVLNSGSSDFTGESDDDREELLSVANSTRNASNLACSGPFWKKMEHFFGSVISEDASFLKEQLNLTEELDELLSQMFGNEHNALGVLMHEEVPVYSGGRQTSHSNQESVKYDAFCGGLDMGRRFDKIPLLYQRVLSAFIEEDEGEELYHQNEGRNMSFQCPSDDSHCGSCNHIDVEPKEMDRIESEVESELDLQTQKHCLLDRFSCNKSVSSNTNSNRSVSSSLCNNEQWQADDGLSYLDAGLVPGMCQNDLGLPHPSQINVSAVSSFDCEYQMLSLEDRLLLELHSIGLYPETMPHIAEGEEGIGQDIIDLQVGLFQQVGKLKKKLGKIDKAIEYGRDVERRNVEQVAMNQLIEMAYRKRMACRGNHSSKSVVRRVSKQVVLAFVKRTLSRCRKFEDTGRSCFCEPALQDVIFSAPPRDNGVKSADCVGSRTRSNVYNEARNHKAEPRGSATGVISSALERRNSLSDNPDRGLSGAQATTIHSSEEAFRDEHILNKEKKREVLLDDVVGSASSKTTLLTVITHISGTKEKRSDRDKDKNREILTSNSVSGTGRPSVGSFRSDLKSKAKPKQKINDLSTSGNVLQGRFMEAKHPVYPSVHGSSPLMGNDSNMLSRDQGMPSPVSFPQDSSKEGEEPADFANLQLNELDSIGMGVSNDDLGGAQDLGSWLNFDDDGLQDHDSIGLEIPMDDLSDLQMLM